MSKNMLLIEGKHSTALGGTKFVIRMNVSKILYVKYDEFFTNVAFENSSETLGIYDPEMEHYISIVQAMDKL